MISVAAETASLVDDGNPGLPWMVALVVLAALVAFVVYKLNLPREPIVIPSSEPGDRKGANEVLASVYSSARFEAAKIRKSQCLMQVLGIDDRSKDFKKITDNFKTVEEVSNAVKKAGVESSNLIFGIDFTKSNLYNGSITFQGNSLHMLDKNNPNPYQRVISILGKTLAACDEDNLIPAFGFGDKCCEDKRVFPLKEGGEYCQGFQEVLEVYNKVVPKIGFGGPTDLSPLIREAVRIVEKSGLYHILVIISDGQVTAQRRTQDAIVEASYYPLSIILVGVGDGPWELMEEFDDNLPKRNFDNFQFVHYESTVVNAEFPEPTFALNALMEIPGQFQQIKEQGLLGKGIK